MAKRKKSLTSQTDRKRSNSGGPAQECDSSEDERSILASSSILSTSMIDEFDFDNLEAVQLLFEQTENTLYIRRAEDTTTPPLLLDHEMLCEEILSQPGTSYTPCTPSKDATTPSLLLIVPEMLCEENLSQPGTSYTPCIPSKDATTPSLMLIVPEKLCEENLSQPGTSYTPCTPSKTQNQVVPTKNTQHAPSPSPVQALNQAGPSHLSHPATSTKLSWNQSHKDAAHPEHPPTLLGPHDRRKQTQNQEVPTKDIQHVSIPPPSQALDQAGPSHSSHPASSTQLTWNQSHNQGVAKPDHSPGHQDQLSQTQHHEDLLPLPKLTDHSTRKQAGPDTAQRPDKPSSSQQQNTQDHHIRRQEGSNSNINIFLFRQNLVPLNTEDWDKISVELIMYQAIENLAIDISKSTWNKFRLAYQIRVSTPEEASKVLSLIKKALPSDEYSLYCPALDEDVNERRLNTILPKLLSPHVNAGLLFRLLEIGAGPPFQGNIASHARLPAPPKILEDSRISIILDVSEALYNHIKYKSFKLCLVGKTLYFKPIKDIKDQEILDQGAQNLSIDGA